jgi:hypothetical protein
MANDGWVYQGRQEHGWFGDGRKPGGDLPDSDVVGQGLDDRIRGLGRAAVAAIPARQRHHAAASFDAAALARLVRVMRAWVGGLHLSPAEFASRFIGRAVDDPVVEHFRTAAERVAGAWTQTDLREATGALAAGMLGVGLDRWRRELGELETRAEVQGNGSAGASNSVRYTLRLTVSGAPYDVAAIDYNPMDVPLSPAAIKVEDRLNEIGQAIVIRLTGRFDNYTVTQAGSILHAIFAAAVEAANIPGVTVEQSFAPDGEIKNYGADGSKRTDVLFRNPENNKVEGIWDWKVGKAELTVRRAKELVEHVDGTAGSPVNARRIPVRMLRVKLLPGPG